MSERAMDSVAARPATLIARAWRRRDAQAVSTWALAGGLVLYLGLDGGGYDIVVHSQVGIIVWWMLLVGAAWGVLPAARFTRLGWASMALFGAFVGWTLLGSGWAPSSDLALQSVSLTAGYLGVLVLALAVHRDREVALRHTISAVATAGTLIAGFALLSRLRPDMFSASHQTASFLGGGTRGRIAWPLNYWNGLAALVALLLPLLLANATRARTLLGQAAAAGAIPMVSLCAYLTFSRGGAIAATAGVLVFFALAEDRIPKLATMLTAAGGSAILIAGAVHRSAVEKGLSGSAAHHQGKTLLVAVVLVSGGVAMAQAGIGLATRHAALPRLLRVPLARARWLLAGGVVIVVVVALAAHVPHHLNHAWTTFKTRGATTLHQDTLNRFSSASGNGRYDYWVMAAHTSSQHLLRGWGAGAFQQLWPSRAPVFSSVLNTHNLYLETLLDGGLIGLALLASFLALLLVAAILLVARSEYELRTRAAAVAAAIVSFALSASIDWVWQIPAIPVAIILLGAAVLAPKARPKTAVAPGPPAPMPAGRAATVRRFAPVVALRAGLIVVSVACLVVIGIPLAMTTAIRHSQSAVASNQTANALIDARAAANIEPDAAAPQLQQALVLEVRQDYPNAVAAIHRATADEPLNWQLWLVRSRLEAENGQPKASLASYRQARSLNPKSPLFDRA
jgi:O-Antigen ligase